jgi:hypothetical protein
MHLDSLNFMQRFSWHVAFTTGRAENHGNIFNDQKVFLLAKASGNLLYKPSVACRVTT